MSLYDVPIGPEQLACYADALAALKRARVEFLVGGGFGLCCYLAHWRATKDLDVFVRPTAVHDALRALDAAGFEVELTDPNWLAKARRKGSLTDLIFYSYNGLFPVDERWFENAQPGRVLGVDVQLVGIEEMIVSKAFVAARDRFDGSDIAWLLRNYGEELDWRRIEDMLGDAHWEVLHWQLAHFLYVFPSERAKIPQELLRRLTCRFLERLEAPTVDAVGTPLDARGRMLDPISYQVAVDRREEWVVGDTAIGEVDLDEAPVVEAIEGGAPSPLATVSPVARRARRRSS